jgi:hypothetical protein
MLYGYFYIYLYIIEVIKFNYLKEKKKEINLLFFYLINFNSIGKRYDFLSTGSSIKFVLINKNKKILYLNQ